MFTLPPDEIQQLEYRSCSSRVSFGRQVRFIRESRNMRPRRFSPLLNKWSVAESCFCLQASSRANYRDFIPVPFRCCRSVHSFTLCLSELSSATRSEERRVGNVCRYGW